MNREERIGRALAVSTDTRVFEMGRGVIDRVPDCFRRFFGGRRAVVVADVNTWPAAGKDVYERLVSSGIPTDKYIIDKKEFHAEWKYIEMVDKILDGDISAAKEIEEDDLHREADASKAFRTPSDSYPVAVAVGSGVINDLCKLCSHHHGQQYLTVPTAASVDGYSSFGASISYQNAKQTFDCPAPVAIVADIDVIANAPKEMTAAGYADLASKVPAGGEWMIADLVGAEPIIPSAWHILQDDLDAFLSSPEKVAAGDPDAIADLFEGLTLSGFAMQAARSSRPASCCDHLFSHIMDMTHHRFNGKLQSHGFQVAIGTLTMCAVFDEFLKMDLSKIDVESCVAAWPSLEEEQERALRVFKDFPAPTLGYDNITKKYTSKESVREELTLFKEHWGLMSAALRAQVWPFRKMQEHFRIVAAPSDPSDIGISREALRDMFPIVQLMRWRFNLLDLAKRGGFYDSLVSPVFAPGGAWEL